MSIQAARLCRFTAAPHGCPRRVGGGGFGPRPGGARRASAPRSARAQRSRRADRTGASGNTSRVAARTGAAADTGGIPGGLGGWRDLSAQQTGAHGRVGLQRTRLRPRLRGGPPGNLLQVGAREVVSPGEPVGIRRDARWNVPEPELTLVINSSGRIVGFTIGNDMSSRDIEGENLLYLPQAKIYSRLLRDRSLGGRWRAEKDARQWAIRLEIRSRRRERVRRRDARRSDQAHVR